MCDNKTITQSPTKQLQSQHNAQMGEPQGETRKLPGTLKYHNSC